MSYTLGGACPEHLCSFLVFFEHLCGFGQFWAILSNFR